MSSLLLGLIANPLKSDENMLKKSVQLVRGSSFRNELLQNPYFNTTIVFGIIFTERELCKNLMFVKVTLGSKLFFGLTQYVGCEVRVYKLFFL